MKDNHWQAAAVALSNLGVYSWRDIAELLEVPKSTCSDHLRKYYGALEAVAPVGPIALTANRLEPKYDNSRVLFISDMHIPYCHRNLLPFLETLKKRYDPTRVVILGDECFPPDVEVLTDKGFIRFDALADQNIGQWGEDGTIEFVPAERKIVKQFSGSLLEYKHRGLTIRTTPKHNLVKINPLKGTVHKREAWDSAGSEAWHIPRNGKQDGPGIDLTDDEIRMMVAFQADGTYTKDAARFQFSKERKIERWLHLANSIGLSFTEHTVQRERVRQFYVKVEDVPAYFTKTFTVPVADFSLSQKEVFLRELGHWDGTEKPNRVRYVSEVPENVEYIYAMAVLAGYTPSKINSAGGSCSYTDIVWARENCTLKSAQKIDVPYEGLVYCVTVPSGMIVVRTDGQVCVSGNCDKHAMSFHDSDPDLPSAGDELLRSLPVIKAIETLFPVAEVIDSNHGSLVYRKAKHHGIPRSYIKGYNEVLGVGSGWTWHNDLVLDMSKWGRPDVYVHHGKSRQAVKVSQAMSMSHVCGHFHEAFGVEFWANPKGLYFGMNSGCLIDDEQLAFAYNNANLKRPIIGTSLIIEGNPVLEAMPL